MEAKKVKRLYTIEEAAVYLGRGKWGIRHLIYDGKLPAVRVGKRIHKDVEDMNTFIIQNKVREGDVAA